MQTLQLNIPDNIDLDFNQTIRFLAAKLYESGKVTLGQAAEVAGLSKLSFSEIISDFGVSLINYSVYEAIADANKLTI
ncbi:MAG: hypothetical protein HW421_3328 [Ignavibacteria bacterium]|nr:hypothetical protein [Ignavibacteria bacterium]